MSRVKTPVLNLVRSSRGHIHNTDYVIFTNFPSYSCFCRKRLYSRMFVISDIALWETSTAAKLVRSEQEMFHLWRTLTVCLQSCQFVFSFRNFGRNVKIINQNQFTKLLENLLSLQKTTDVIKKFNNYFSSA